jgi:hypothetical protein
MQCSHTRRRSVPLFSPRCSLLTKKTDLLSKSARGDTRGRGEVRVDEYGAVRTGQGHAVRERCLLAAPDDALVLVEQSAHSMVHNMEYMNIRWTTRYVQVLDERASAVQERYPQGTAARNSGIIIGAVEHLEQHTRRVDVGSRSRAAASPSPRRGMGRAPFKTLLYGHQGALLAARRRSSRPREAARCERRSLARSRRPFASPAVRGRSCSQSRARPAKK